MSKSRYSLPPNRAQVQYLESWPGEGFHGSLCQMHSIPSSEAGIHTSLPGDACRHQLEGNIREDFPCVPVEPGTVWSIQALCTSVLRTGHGCEGPVR
jgi:hypothetical protein